MRELNTGDVFRFLCDCGKLTRHEVIRVLERLPSGQPILVLVKCLSCGRVWTYP